MPETLNEDVHELTDFQRNTDALIDQMKRTHRPLVLTVDGKVELIVQDAEGYNQILERLDRLEAVDAIRVGIEDAKAGRVRPAREALSKLQEKLGISD
jgi:PHD/YefM family antitoxin component YafN of YafNO toxin-antitoxin module